MTGIKIDNRLLVREITKTINRNKNSMTFTIQVDPLKDVIYAQESFDEFISIHLTIKKDAEEDIWMLLKDATNKILMEYLYDLLCEWKAVCTAEKALPTTEMINEPGVGEVEVTTSESVQTPEYLKKVTLSNSQSELLGLFSLIESYNFEMMEI